MPEFSAVVCDSSDDLDCYGSLINFNVREAGLMVSEKVIVNNALGIHLRPAGSLAEEAMKYTCSISLIRKDKRVNGKSLLSILSLGIKNGYEVEIRCDGKDEQQALEALVRILQ